VQADPIKPMLKPPRTKHLKLKCDILPSTFAFKLYLRRYIQVLALEAGPVTYCPRHVADTRSEPWFLELNAVI
jgi:hypothetical protein